MVSSTSQLVAPQKAPKSNNNRMSWLAGGHIGKVIIEKSRGEVSLMEKDTIENVS